MKLELVCGDIAKQPDVEAAVNAANAELRSGGGLAGAILDELSPFMQQAFEVRRTEQERGACPKAEAEKARQQP
ncbi:MAG TPA: hypothetical protein VLT81_15995 [Chondromyces sp.]|nr:hypothetical protein [Chondromyces sp.]